MAFGGALVQLAQVSIASSAASASSGTDVSNQVTDFTIIAAGNVLTVPPTGTTDESVALGATRWSVAFGWLANDEDNAAMTKLVYAALRSTAPTLYFEGKMTNAAISATNPRWFGTFLASEWQLGGAQKTLLLAKQTFRMTAAASYLYT